MFFLANWKIIAIGSLFALIFFSGWHARVVYDGYKTEKTENNIIKKLGKGASNIIAFHGEVDRLHETDKCLDSPSPASYNILLK